MGNRTQYVLSTVITCLLILTSQAVVSFAGNANTDSKLTPEQLISEHVKSIGSPSLLGSVQSRAFVGSTNVHFIQGMQGSIENGRSMFVADGNKVGIKLEYKTRDYDSEYFSYDGKEVSVGHIAPGQKSPLADFLFRFNGIMKKGFLGGALSVNWPSMLENVNEPDKLKLEKAMIDDQDLYVLEWPMKTLGNVKIQMYFDPATYHHVRTVYTIRVREDVSVQADGYEGQLDDETGEIGVSALPGSAIPDSIYVLTEKFEDFKKVKGMTLPHKYTLDYSLEGQGTAFMGEWILQADKWVFNRKFDEKIFKAQK
jgi:hypothetical protein